MTPVASVVIPAHNEGTVIDRCLSAILADAAPGELEVVVVCNGCADDTAQRARRHGADVRVVELTEASKPAALNAGDEAATAFPRVYVDADIEVSTAAVRRVAAVLSSGRALAASPRLDLDLTGCSLPVRWYYRAWTELDYVRRSRVGSGVYGVSAAGRERFGRFPEIIADDLFVRCHFAPSEREAVADIGYVVRPPRTVRALVRSKTRVFAGNAQLRDGWPELRDHASGGGRGRRRLLQRSPDLAGPLATYLAIQGSAKALGLVAYRRGRLEWRRDVTSRA